MDFRRDRVTALAQQVRSKELSATELTQHSLRMIEERNRDINAFVAVDAEKALEQAAAIDQIVASGGDPGPLAGLSLIHI